MAREALQRHQSFMTRAMYSQGGYERALAKLKDLEAKVETARAALQGLLDARRKA